MSFTLLIGSNIFYIYLYSCIRSKLFMYSRLIGLVSLSINNVLEIISKHVVFINIYFLYLVKGYANILYVKTPGSLLETKGGFFQVLLQLICGLN